MEINYGGKYAHINFQGSPLKPHNGGLSWNLVWQFRSMVQSLWNVSFVKTVYKNFTASDKDGSWLTSTKLNVSHQLKMSCCASRLQYKCMLIDMHTHQKNPWNKNFFFSGCTSADEKLHTLCLRTSAHQPFEWAQRYEVELAIATSMPRRVANSCTNNFHVFFWIELPKSALHCSCYIYCILYR